MIQKLLGTILILAAIYGGYVLYSKHAETERLARNPWKTKMAPYIKMHTAKEQQKGGMAASESSFLAIVFFAWQASEDNYDEMDTIVQAAKQAGAGNNEASRIATSVHESVAFAKSMGIFSDVANAVTMERGEPPICHAKGWEDERLVVGHLISPTLAPEASFAIPNLRLMPECVREMSTDKVRSGNIEVARKWLVDQLIFPDSFRAISEKAKEKE